MCTCLIVRYWSRTCQLNIDDCRRHHAIVHHRMGAVRSGRTVDRERDQAKRLRRRFEDAINALFTETRSNYGMLKVTKAQ